jgi:hypothetical protein
VIHDWPAFWTVLCLGITQITSSYYSSTFEYSGLVPRRSQGTGGEICLSTTCGLFRKTGQTIGDQSFAFSTARTGRLDRTRFTARRKQSWIEYKPGTEGRVFA